MGFGMMGSCCCGGAIAYHSGGADAFFSTFYSTTNKTLFSSDVTSAVTTAALSIARAEASPVANPATAGYFGGGRSSAVTARTDKLTFSGETMASMTTANLSSARSYAAGISERSSKGYFLGGSTTGGTPGVVTSDQLTFSGDTTSAQTSANLSAVRYGISGITEGTSKGYIGGGSTAGSAFVSTADKITFSTDTNSAQTTANMGTARLDYYSMSDGSTKGYWAGGQTGTAVNNVDKVTFSTDVASASTTNTMAKQGGGGSSSGTIGYAAGGNDNTSGTIKYLNKFTFSTDLQSALGTSSDLSVAKARVHSLSTAAL